MLAAAEGKAIAAGTGLPRLDCSAATAGLRRYHRQHGYVELEEVERSTWRVVLFEKDLRGLTHG